MGAVIPAIVGAASSIGGALAAAAPVLGPAATIGSAVIGANSARQQASSQLEAARLATASRGAATPGGSVLSGGGLISPGGTRDINNGNGSAYAGGGNRYNSAQRLSTAPSLSGTGSGFNAASASGQKQPGETGVE